MSRHGPKGIEVLVKKASVDPAFRIVFLERRAAAAKEIGLELDRSEAAMLAAVPTGQLEALIARTEVSQEHRRAFLGQVAAAMLAALGVTATGVSSVDGAPLPPNVGLGGMMADDPSKDPRDEDIERRVVAMIAKRFRTAKTNIKSDTSLVDDLHADATQLAGLKRQLEKQFKLKISKKDFEKISTVGDAVKYVQDAIQTRRTSGLVARRAGLRARADLAPNSSQPLTVGGATARVCRYHPGEPEHAFSCGTVRRWSGSFTYPWARST